MSSAIWCIPTAVSTSSVSRNRSASKVARRTAARSRTCSAADKGRLILPPWSGEIEPRLSLMSTRIGRES